MSRRWRHVVIGLLALTAVVVVGTIGYVLLGFELLDAAYQTVTTITTVGFREVEPLDGAGQIFTMILILAGVGTALYTLTVLLELLVEGHLGESMERRRMEKQIGALRGHVVLCGWGRVGRAIADELAEAGRSLVVIDLDPERVATITRHPWVLGDATNDETLRRAGIERAQVLVAALETDAENLFVTLSGRALQPELFIVARARDEASVAKLSRAGADRVVNPQEIGGARMAAFVLQPHVTEFLDVVMRERGLEYRLEEIELPQGCPFGGLSLRDAHLRDRTGALILAMKGADGQFATNPSPETTLDVGQVLIAIGTEVQLRALADAAEGTTRERATRTT